jgi:hypothetical protein
VANLTKEDVLLNGFGNPVFVLPLPMFGRAAVIPAFGNRKAGEHGHRNDGPR